MNEFPLKDRGDNNETRQLLNRFEKRNDSIFTYRMANQRRLSADCNRHENKAISKIVDQSLIFIIALCSVYWAI